MHPINKWLLIFPLVIICFGCGFPSAIGSSDSLSSNNQIYGTQNSQSPDSVQITASPTRINALTTPSSVLMKTETPHLLSPTRVSQKSDSDFSVCQNNSCLENRISFNYLVVTRPLFLQAVQPFVKWKQSQGYRVGIVTVEWINQYFQGRHLAEKIKTGMHTLRKQAGVVYVLLVGDTAIDDKSHQFADLTDSYSLDPAWNVPTGFYRRLDMDPPGDVLPSDAYYVEDRDWDPTNTNLNPVPNQKNGEGRMKADLFIGRWPIRQASDLQPIIQKTISVIPASNILFTADVTTVGQDSSCKIYPPDDPKQNFFCYLDTFGKGLSLFFKGNAAWLKTEELYVDVSQAAQARALIAKITSYNGAIVASYHGDIGCWWLQKENCMAADELNFSTISPLLEIESCSVIAFYTTEKESFAEALLKKPLGPAVISQSPASVPYLQALRNGDPVGKAFWNSASNFTYWPNPMGLFGDPSIQVLQHQSP